MATNSSSPVTPSRSRSTESLKRFNWPARSLASLNCQARDRRSMFCSLLKLGNPKNQESAIISGKYRDVSIGWRSETSLIARNFRHFESAKSFRSASSNLSCSASYSPHMQEAVIVAKLQRLASSGEIGCLGPGGDPKTADL